MSKRSSSPLPEGKYLYRHRFLKHQGGVADGQPVILEADTRRSPIVDRETGQQKVDRITGQPLFATANLYGYELHQQLSAQPHLWEDITAEGWPEEPAPKTRGKRSAPEEPASDPEPDPDGDPAEQEPAK